MSMFERSLSGTAAQVRLEHDLELDAVRIGKEDRIVARRVVVLRRWIANRRADLEQEAVKLIDVFAAVGVEGEVMEARHVAIVPRGPALRACRLQGERKKPAAAVRNPPAARVRAHVIQAAIAEPLEHPVV